MGLLVELRIHHRVSIGHSKQLAMDMEEDRHLLLLFVSNLHFGYTSGLGTKGSLITRTVVNPSNELSY